MQVPIAPGWGFRSVVGGGRVFGSMPGVGRAAARRRRGVERAVRRCIVVQAGLVYSSRVSNRFQND